MKRKLKTLAKLLQEFPSAIFDEHGSLIFSGKGSISAHELQFLGKEVDFTYTPSFCYPYHCSEIEAIEEFLEPIEEKPRVAVYRSGWDIVFELEDRPVPEYWIQLGYLKLEDE